MTQSGSDIDHCARLYRNVEGAAGLTDPTKRMFYQKKQYPRSVYVANQPEIGAEKLTVKRQAMRLSNYGSSPVAIMLASIRVAHSHQDPS